MGKKYNNELNTKEWKLKRLKVLKRDNYKCVECGNTNNLHVHHNYYTNGKKAWEYPLNAFKTLCHLCHETHHKNNNIVIKNVCVNKSRLDRDLERINKMKLSLSSKDLEIQKRYDKLRNQLK